MGDSLHTAPATNHGPRGESAAGATVPVPGSALLLLVLTVESSCRDPDHFRIKCQRRIRDRPGTRRGAVADAVPDEPEGDVAAQMGRSSP